MYMNEDNVLPRNFEAEAQYAAAWDAYRLALTDEERDTFEKRMDSLQPRIAIGPRDPRWKAFADALPGYREFWSFYLDKAIKTVEERVKEEWS